MTLSVHIKRLGNARRTLMRDLHLHAGAGEVLTLMGPSGCGKSSLLAAIAGTLKEVAEGTQSLCFEGSVMLGGQDLTLWPTAQRGIGLLFQDPLLFAHLSVEENLLFATPPGTRAQRQAQVNQALAESGLEGFGQADPATLSGGQRTRVALMRALLARPRALLLDEPFSRLDAPMRQQMREFVWKQVRARALPTLVVTHDSADVADPTRVVQLSEPDHVG